MHKLLIVIGFCLVTFLGVISCYDEHNTFEDRLVDSDLRNISMDTSTIVMTAVLIDSLETSGKQVVLAGRYVHRYGEGLCCQLHTLRATPIFDRSGCDGKV